LIRLTWTVQFSKAARNELAAEDRQHLTRLALMQSFRDGWNVVADESHSVGTHHYDTDEPTSYLILIL
jgi:hypothetical protein